MVHSLLLYIIFFVFIPIYILVNYIEAIGDVYRRLGVPKYIVPVVLLATLLGSLVDVPVAYFEGSVVRTVQISRWGIVWEVPFVSSEFVTIAVNVGGAVVPILMSLFLILKTPERKQILYGTALVTLVMYYVAEPVQGFGIVAPFFVAPIVSVIAGMAFSENYRMAVAYVSGSLGTLIGADLLHLPEILNLGASVASIGGAGIWDGIFLTGVMAAVLSSRD